MFCHWNLVGKSRLSSALSLLPLLFFPSLFSTIPPGKLIICNVTGIAHRRPQGESYDQAIRNDETGLWQCPFCQQDNFPELSEVCATVLLGLLNFFEWVVLLPSKGVENEIFRSCFTKWIRKRKLEHMSNVKFLRMLVRNDLCFHLFWLST